MTITDTWQSAFQSRTDLEPYGDNASGLFALSLGLGVEDLASVAADAITDGSDDKKCDLVYVDREERYALIAQCYLCRTDKPSAPANKASDLNTAVSWLLQAPVESLPIRIRSAAELLRTAINDGMIEKLHVWYVHNLPESLNVQAEINIVEHTAKSALRSQFPTHDVLVSGLEVGRFTLDSLYTDSLSPILVNDEYSVEVPGGFRLSSDDWEAYITAFPLSFLRRVYRKHKTKLFSANVRDYLGSRKTDQNINYGIKTTAENNPKDFWVYNNGLTILVHDFAVIESRQRLKLKINGISIVNGAQTTGSVASLRKLPDQTAHVPVRVIRTVNQDLIYDIIRYNNSQNKVTASDFRSTDRIQKRLRDEFALVLNAEYEGGRRGGAQDKIRRRANLLPSYTVGQALAAFHGDPIVAYNEKSHIWVSDSLYSRYFNDQVTAGHIVLCFSLLRSVESLKVILVSKAKLNEDALTATEAQQLAFFRNRGSIFLFASAMSACIETFLSSKVSNRFRLSFDPTLPPQAAQMLWTPLVSANAPFCTHLVDAFSDGLKNTERVRKAIQTFQGLVQVTASANSSLYTEFAFNVSNN